MTFRGMLKTAAGAGILVLPSAALAETITDQNTAITGVGSTAQVTVELIAEVTGNMILEVEDATRATTLLTGDGNNGGFGGEDDYGTVNFGQVTSGGILPATGNVYPASAASSSAYVAELSVKLTYTGLDSAIVTIEGAQPTGTAGTTAGAPEARWACDGNVGSTNWGSYAGTVVLGAAATCATWTGSTQTETVYPVDLAFIVSPTTAPDTWEADYVFTAVPTIVP